MRALLICVALGCGGSSQPPTLHTSIAGNVAVADRLAIETMVVLGDGIVVQTASGNLVRYDRALRFVADVVPPSPVRVLTPGLVALADRSIATLDASLRVDVIGKTTGDARWVGRHRDRVLAIVDAEDGWSLEVVGGEPLVTIPMAHPKHRPSAFLLDGDTLWFGANGGEWGGRIGRIDLAARTLNEHARDEAREPVHGFLMHRGRVLRHGGLAHLSIRRATIAVVDERGATPVWRRSSGRRPAPPPAHPITHLLPTPAGFVAVSRGVIYEAPEDFSKWTKLADVGTRTTAMVALGDAFVIATHDRGLYVWRAGKLARVAP